MQISKYNANGNDFVIFHTFVKKNRANLAKKLCDRFNGIGADGLIVLLPHKSLDFEWEFYNSDGSVAKMCGNGSRAAALYAYTQGLSGKKMSFLTGAGEINALVEDECVESELSAFKILNKKITRFNKEWFFVDTGVPHLVTIVDNLEKFDIKLAKKMRKKFNANVNFMMIKNKNIFVRTFERGVEAETLACGTGMAACFLYGYQKGLLKNETIAYPKSNDKINLRIKNNKLFLKGKVTKCFDTIVENVI